MSIFSKTVESQYKLHRNWTLLGKHTISVTEHSLQERLRVGAAFRDTDTNVWNALVRYEFKYETDDRQETKRQVHILASNVNYQPFRPLILSGYLATKWVLEGSNGLSSDANTHLLSSRVTYDILPRWDAGLTASALFSDAFDTVQYGVGLETGLMVATNLWLSVGYNFFGFHDDDLTGVNYTNPGVFFRFRYKFDEALLHEAVETVSDAVQRLRPTE